MNDGACPKEQQSFKKCVGEEMKNGDAITTCTQCHKHVAQLRTGGIGDDAFDVILYKADGGRKECGDRSRKHHNIAGGGRKFKQRRHAGHQEHASRDHGGSMNEC